MRFGSDIESLRRYSRRSVPRDSFGSAQRKAIGLPPEIILDSALLQLVGELGTGPAEATPPAAMADRNACSTLAVVFQFGGGGGRVRWARVRRVLAARWEVGA